MMHMESTSSSEYADNQHLNTPEAKKYGAITNPKPGPAPRVAYFHQAPEDHMTSAILTTLFCFCPLGCIAIFYSYKSRDNYKKRNLVGANKATENSKIMSQMAIAVGIVLYIAGTISLLVKLADVI